MSTLSMAEVPELEVPQHLLNRHTFLFGAATSAYQIEGRPEGREPCIWDAFCTQPGAIRDGSNGKDACQALAHWQEDFALIKQLGLDAYRFSISWPRVIDANGQLKADGLACYQQMLDDLQQAGIASDVTLYHWDLPLAMEQQGGWLNRDTAYRFADYAEKVSQALAGKVTRWCTLNEPWCSAHLGYETGVHAPGKKGRFQGQRAAHHLLLAHGLAAQAIRAADPGSQVGIVLNVTPCYAISEQRADMQASDNADMLHNHWYLSPLLEGKYPDGELAEQILTHVPMQKGDMTTIAQPLDFLGLNYYHPTRVAAAHQADREYQPMPVAADCHINAMGWECDAKGLKDILLQLHQRYVLPPVMITENGYADELKAEQGRVRDKRRSWYLQQHLQALAEAISSGVDVRGYFAWSLLDNFEWTEGFSKRFGLIYVDYATQQRIIKDSGLAYQQMLARRR